MKKPDILFMESPQFFKNLESQLAENQEASMQYRVFSSQSEYIIVAPGVDPILKNWLADIRERFSNLKTQEDKVNSVTNFIYEYFKLELVDAHSTLIKKNFAEFEIEPEGARKLLVMGDLLRQRVGVCGHLALGLMIALEALGIDSEYTAVNLEILENGIYRAELGGGHVIVQIFKNDGKKLFRDPSWPFPHGGEIALGIGRFSYVFENNMKNYVVKYYVNSARSFIKKFDFLTVAELHKIYKLTGR
jgi:hypothetical protein